MANRYTKEMAEFIKENQDKYTRKEFVNIFNSHFGVEYSYFSLRNYFNRAGLVRSTNAGCFKKGEAAWNKGIKGSTGTHENCRKTQFKKGDVPKNYRAVGSERLNVYGYWEIKVRGGKFGWDLKHRVIWR